MERQLPTPIKSWGPQLFGRISTGALLVGEKGSGKTLLAMKIAMDAQTLGWPTILVNSAYGGEGFMSFIQSIDMPCIILFDEFEKVYADKSRSINSLSNSDSDARFPQGKPGWPTTLLNGVYASKKLFLLTANDRWKISPYLKNRPGRIHYMIGFEGLDEDFIREYCSDNLSNPAHIQGVVNLAYLFEHFNFDMLQALIEEMNRYGESAQDAVKLLNINAFEDSYGSSYTVTASKNGKTVEVHQRYQKLDQNPLTHGRFSTYVKTGHGEDKYQNEYFEPRELLSVDKDGNMAFQNSSGLRIDLKKVKLTVYDYSRIGEVL